MGELLSVFECILLDDHSAVPKYQQVAKSIIKGILKGKISKEQVLPSLSELSFELDISRDTAERAYKYLKDIGILGSVPGKGYFVKSTDVERQLRVFLLFNKISAAKKIIYDSIVAGLNNQAIIDLYIYHNNVQLFKKIIFSKKEEYTHYVVIPHLSENGDDVREAINAVNKDKLILLDMLPEQISGDYAAVYENFEYDIYTALQQALPHLKKYRTLKIIFPVDSYFPRAIVKGFQDFCREHSFDSKVIHDVADEKIEKGEVYISLIEDDLVSLVEKMLSAGLVAGEDVGVISYNETPVKKVILQGITTISTDFKWMGRKTAELILSKRKEQIHVPFHLTLRPSL